MQSDIRFIEGKVISRYYEKPITETGYHYVYSYSKGKMILAYYSKTIPEKYMVTFVFLNDTITHNNKTIYNNDYVLINYKKVYYDGIFHHNQIIKIE